MLFCVCLLQVLYNPYYIQYNLNPEAKGYIYFITLYVLA